ncbi:MAG: hypothetical protein IKC01_00875, partial [Clostridia bacterium]|nr:hypothetical protein [Clostridia bacterium]
KSRIKTPLFPVIYGNVSSIDIFTDDKLKNKKLAVKKANEIISELPKGLSDTEKALEIYRYLHKNVEYIDYDETKQEENYIYDALVLGKTNCDGFANAFSLLCKLTDIPCFEKMYLPKTGEDDKEEPESTSETTLPQEETTEDKKIPAESDEKEQEPDENEGHTWNVVKLGGKWYNADATNSTICFEADTCDTLYPFFGFSDKNQIYNHVYAELLPVCEEDLLKPDCTLKSFADDDAVSEMSKAYYKNDEKYILVYAEEKSDLYDDTMQELANTLRTSIYHESYEEYFSKLYFVYPE